MLKEIKSQTKDNKSTIKKRTSFTKTYTVYLDPLFSIQYQGLLALRERHTEQDTQSIATTQNMMIRVHNIVEFTAVTFF